jgi:hypothetical protein
VMGLGIAIPFGVGAGCESGERIARGCSGLAVSGSRGGAMGSRGSSDGSAFGEYGSWARQRRLGRSGSRRGPRCSGWDRLRSGSQGRSRCRGSSGRRSGRSGRRGGFGSGARRMHRDRGAESRIRGLVSPCGCILFPCRLRQCRVCGSNGRVRGLGLGAVRILHDGPAARVAGDSDHARRVRRSEGDSRNTGGPRPAGGDRRAASKDHTVAVKRDRPLGVSKGFAGRGFHWGFLSVSEGAAGRPWRAVARFSMQG